MKKLNMQVVRIPAQEPRWLTILEIIVVLCIALFPSLQKSVLAFLYPDRFGQQPFLWFSLNGIAGLVWVTIPVLYIMWRGPYSWKDFGLDKFRFPRDIGLGILSILGIWIFCFIFLFIFMMIYLSFGGTPPTPEKSPVFQLITGPSGRIEYAVMVLFTLGVGFSEELIMRGYLMTKMQTIKDNMWFVVLGSSLIFGVGHIYQGLYAVLGTSLLGVGFATIFWYWRRLWPIAIAHALHDMAAFTAISYLHHLK